MLLVTVWLSFDNAVTGAAVLAAVTIEPLVKDYVFPSAAYEEPIHKGTMSIPRCETMFALSLTNR